MTILDNFRLDGKIALVTGASRGLGQSMAVGLAEAGADIAGLDRTPDCAETCDQVGALGRRFMNISLDLGDGLGRRPQRDRRQRRQEFGGPDILVNNAGIIRRTPALDFSEETGSRAADRSEGVFRLQAAAPVGAADAGRSSSRVDAVVSRRDSGCVLHRGEERRDGSPRDGERIRRRASTSTPSLPATWRPTIRRRCAPTPLASCDSRADPRRALGDPADSKAWWCSWLRPRPTISMVR